MLSAIFTSWDFWLGFLAGAAVLIFLAYLYNYMNMGNWSHCDLCGSENKDIRQMVWVRMPDGTPKLVRCSDGWHNA